MENFNNENEEEIEETFKILGNPNRLKIICILSKSDDKEATVSQIAQRLNITQPAASQHLKLLKTAKIVKSEKKGSNIYYKINTETLTQHKECIDALYQIILK
jgi:DNA-binding transcriptional ArsR family regulator